eukprot:NODE_6433_length_847_cov_133.828729_g6197_i0.p1 GENE.NODE_6433_length_847_cov_133.828729_g6197_i0~~NODE_6433_length_847_cov_133.828729_g6197_i0.p1  ORF type:complete len:240 (+),score=29.11 NODE_6433_length_847_cov_133.828729_g6197_i0:81-722(+)
MDKTDKPRRPRGSELNKSHFTIMAVMLILFVVVYYVRPTDPVDVVPGTRSEPTLVYGHQVHDHRAGHSSVHDSELVVPAPPNTLKGDQTRFDDARGSYQQLRFGENQYLNVIFTKAGHQRSGDLHKCAQVNYISWGQVRLTLVRHGREYVSEHSAGDVITIPAHVPHLYYFDKDTLMTEQWRHPDGSPCPFEAFFYTPLRERIAKNSTAKQLS